MKINSKSTASSSYNNSNTIAAGTTQMWYKMNGMPAGNVLSYVACLNEHNILALVHTRRTHTKRAQPDSRLLCLTPTYIYIFPRSRQTRDSYYFFFYFDILFYFFFVVLCLVHERRIR